MHVKKIVLIGIIALVIIGCVLAAGCTSTPTVAPTTAPTTSTTPTPTQVASTVDPWLGVWSCTNYKTAEGTVYTNAALILEADGDAHWIMTDSEGRLVDGAIINETWIKTGPTTFTVKNPSTGKSYNYVYDAATPSVTVQQGDVTNVLIRFGLLPSPESWDGLWSCSNYIKETGNVAEEAFLALLADGSAYWFTSDSKSTSNLVKESWEKVNATTFTVHNPSSGKTFTYEYNSIKDILTERGIMASNVFNRVGAFGSF